MADIFLSYAREDRKRLVPLVEFLEASDFSVFWDRDIRPGYTWRSVLAEELRKSRCVIVAWSEQSVASEWVLDEAESAKADKRLLPVLLARVDPPLGFRAIQAVDLSSWSRNEESVALHALVDAVRVRLNASEFAMSAPPVQVQTTSLRRVGGRRQRRLIAGMAGFGVAVGVFTWFWFATHKPTPSPAQPTATAMATAVTATAGTARPVGTTPEQTLVTSPGSTYRRVYYETFDDRSGIPESVR